MEPQVTLICRACKTPNIKESKYFLKFYKKNVTVPCDHCSSSINVLADDAFFNNVSTDDEERTKVFVQKTEIWVTHKPVNIFIRNADSFDVIKVVLQEGCNIIGRAPEKDPEVNCVRIETADRSLSRSHITITTEQRHEGFAHLIKDNNSSNGTFLNDEKLTKYDEVYLESEDVITIGTVEITMSKPL